MSGTPAAGCICRFETSLQVTIRILPSPPTHRAVYSNRCSVVGAPSTVDCSTTGEKKPCTVDAASTLSLALPMPSCMSAERRREG